MTGMHPRSSGREARIARHGGWGTLIQPRHRELAFRMNGNLLELDAVGGDMVHAAAHAAMAHAAACRQPPAGLPPSSIFKFGTVPSPLFSACRPAPVVPHRAGIRCQRQSGGVWQEAAAAMAPHPLADQLDLCIPTIRDLEFLEQWCGRARRAGEGLGGAPPSARPLPLARSDLRCSVVESALTTRLPLLPHPNEPARSQAALLPALPPDHHPGWRSQPQGPRARG